MSYIALYRKWRPLVFEDVVEQEHVVRTLKNSIVSGRIAHAYLFCGTRGTGKTTMAKIFSRAINCLRPRDGNPCNECEICKGILSQSILDVVEIDAASNNSVDNVREIRDEVVYAPSQARYKVYIIDEVHMLSTGAFNALLKTLEEPPGHVVFILATTEPHKLPATILSRCQRFDFRRISVGSIMKKLEGIALASGVNIRGDASRLIARLSDGALRDAISILDQCISLGGGEITYDDVIKVIGMVNDDFMARVVDAVSMKDAAGILRLVDQLAASGKDMSQFVSDLVYYYRNLLVCKVAERPGEVVEAPEDVLETMKRQSACLEQEEIMLIIKELSLLESSLKWATHPRILIEVTLLKICKDYIGANSENVMERLAMLERKINAVSFGEIPSSKARAAVSGSAGNVLEKKSVDRADFATAGSRAAESGLGGISGVAGEPLEIWGEVLDELKKNGRMGLYTSLIETKAVKLGDKLVGVIFSNRFNKEVVLKADNLKVLESIAGRILGGEIRVKCLDADDVVEKNRFEENAQNDDFIKKAREIAEKFNVPLDIIDE